MKNLSITAFNCVLILIVTAVLAPTVEAQRRDHLTSEEIELVRDVQEIDFRMGLFVNAIERRLWSLNGPEKLTIEQTGRIEKDFEKWGALPQGARQNLISDIDKILNEAIDKFEDVFDREPKSPLIPFAYYVLADYCVELIPKLETLTDGTSDLAVIGPLRRSDSSCRNILEARDQITRPIKKRPKSKITR